MELNGLELVYPFDIAANTNSLADILDDSAAGKMTMDELKAWYEDHKRQIKA